MPPKPSDLTEALAVSPFFQLIPKQDLAPLLSFSRLYSGGPDYTKYVSHASTLLVEKAQKALEDGDLVALYIIEEYAKNLSSFESRDLLALSFKKPVISGVSDRTTMPLSVPPHFQAIYEKQSLVNDLDLVTFETDVDNVDVSSDRLRLLPNYSALDPLVVSPHVRFYEEKLEEEYLKIMRKRQRPSLLSCGSVHSSRKRVHIENSDALSIYKIVDAIGFVDGRNQDDKNCIITDRGITILTLYSAHSLFSELSRLTTSLHASDLESSYLQRIAVLCANTINYYVHLIESDGLDIQNQNLMLLSSKLLFLVINSHPHDRKLHVDSHLLILVDLLSKITKSCVSLSSNFNFTLSPLMLHQHIAESAKGLVDYLKKNKPDELILTKIEYMCIEVVFADLKDMLHDDLRNAMIQLLIQIFKFYPSQRQFIVNEMLANFKKLSQQNNTSRIKLSHGDNVLFISVFLVRLVQSFDTKSMEREINSFKKLEKNKNPHSSKNLKRLSLVSGALAVLNDARGIATQISVFFAEALVGSDIAFKSLFLVFIDDCLTLLTLPDWPGAVLMTESLMSTFCYRLKENKFQGAIEPYALEVVGKVGIEILRIKKRCTVRLDFSANITDNELSELKVLIELVITQTSNEYMQISDVRQFHLLFLRLIKICERLSSEVTKGFEEHIYAINPTNNLSTEIPEKAIQLHTLIDACLGLLAQDNHLVNTREESSRTGENSSSAKHGYLALLWIELGPLYDNFVALLVSYLESSKVKSATKAIKILSSMIDFNPKILLALKISTSISKIMAGNSPLMKEAVVEILGKYIAANPDLIEKYYQDICERAADDGVTLRKRVIKIMKEMYLHKDDKSIRVFISKKMLRRIYDEEPSIRDMSRTSLTALLFLEDLDTSSVKVCQLMIEIVNSPGFLVSNFTDFIAQVIADKSVQMSLKRIVDAAFNIAIDHIETDCHEVKKSLMLVNLLARCDKKLVSFDNMVALHPYVISDQGHTEGVSLQALKILRLFLEDTKSFRKDYIVKLRDGLLSRLTKFDNKELHEAVPAINALSSLTDDKSKMVNAFISTTLLLQPIIAEQKMNRVSLTKCHKLLNLLGCFGSYCDFEGSREIIMRSKVELKEKETVVSLICKYLLVFCASRYDVRTRNVALKNLLCVSTYHPKLFLSEAILTILDKELGHGNHLTKLTIVEGLANFLAKEDGDAIARSNDYSSSSQNLGVSSFNGSSISSLNDGVCASVIQRYIDKILALCLSDHTAFAPVLFLQLVVKLGYANPKMCVPTIIALEASSNKIIKKIAICLHTEIFEKHESLSDRNYPDAVKMAVAYSKRMNGLSFLKQILFFRTVYRIINKQYLSKKKFVLSVAKVFNISLTQFSLEECLDQRDLVVFSAMNLLVLSLSSLEEVCLLLYHLDRVITRDGYDLVDRITSTVGSKSGSGISVDNLQLLFVNSQTILTLIYLRQLLAASYSISSSVMEEFRPSRSNLELRQQPRAITLIDFPLEELEMSTNLAHPGSFGKVFTKVVLLMRNYST